MCGIAGILTHNNSLQGPSRAADRGNPKLEGPSRAGLQRTRDGCSSDPKLQGPSRAALQRMLNAMHHRGPNDEGQFEIRNSKSEIAAGMRRLSIIDLTTGHQPIYNEDGTVAVVFNGEIYNYRELTQELKRRGHHFRTQSDTETIVHAYEEWGQSCVEHLRGMFAFCIVETLKRSNVQRSNLQRLFLARDRMGIKPLYYYQDDDHFVFASEVRALLASGLVPRELDLVALWEYLGYQSVPAPRTLIRGCGRCRPAPGWRWMRRGASSSNVIGTCWRTPRPRGGGPRPRRACAASASCWPNPWPCA